MRSYFTAMQQVISRRQGLVLQYVGDGIEAAFGAPIPCEGHADEAVLAALEMRKGTGETESTAHGKGTSGETVNVAARIQDLTKQFQCDILISEETASLLNWRISTPKRVAGHGERI